MKIVFMGTPEAAAASLRRIAADGHEVAAVYTQPDKPAGRGRKMHVSAVKECALEFGLPVYQPTKIKTADAVETFKNHRADLAVVVAYGRILPIAFLEAFPKGAVNVHFSLLPKYRGAAPVNWAIVNGERETGVTTMLMDEGLDTGAMLLQQRIKIGADETAIDLMRQLATLGADALSETLRRFDELKAVPQDEAQATFAPLMRKEDGAIDWKMSAADIVNRVRGFQPFPTSYASYQGKKLTIWQARETSGGDYRAIEAGAVVEAKGDNLIVECGGRTALLIGELQLEGKKRMAARDFLNGIKLSVGERLS